MVSEPKAQKNRDDISDHVQAMNYNLARTQVRQKQIGPLLHTCTVGWEREGLRRHGGERQSWCPPRPTWGPPDKQQSLPRLHASGPPAYPSMPGWTWLSFPSPAAISFGLCRCLQKRRGKKEKGKKVQTDVASANGGFRVQNTPMKGTKNFSMRQNMSFSRQRQAEV